MSPQIVGKLSIPIFWYTHLVYNVNTMCMKCVYQERETVTVPNYLNHVGENTKKYIFNLI